MTKESRQDGAPSQPGPRAAGEKSDVGPTGLTYREKQRRRIVIAGLAAPTLMSLPSRRAWAMQCSKSKLKKMSGNLSAKKKKTTACDPIACDRTWWKNTADWPMSTAGISKMTDFESYFTHGFIDALDPPMYKTPVNFQMILEKQGDIRDKDADGANSIWNGREGELKSLNKAALTAFLNAHFINNMGFIIDFVINGVSTSAADVVMLYENVMIDVVAQPDDGTAKDYMKDLRENVLEPATENQHCPL